MNIVKTTKGDPDLKSMMVRHYSQPKGFVGRQLFYRIEQNNILYGCIAFGSATKHLPGRNIIGSLNNGLNNIFYHIEKRDEKYPLRNFTTYCLLQAEKIAAIEYELQYGDEVKWLETLVELPRSGDLYLKAGYIFVGTTIGYTCKRVAGKGTDSWGGKRIWNKTDLRPKKVFVKEWKG